MRIRSWKCHPDFPVSADSNVRGCWEFELHPGEQTIPHLHDDGDEINITLEGTGQITVGEVSRKLQPGELIFIPARTRHHMENPNSLVLRGISIETGIEVPGEMDAAEALSVRDLESVISSIPEELNESEALQLIIRLFDLAGHLSERIEHAIGLDNTSGYNALTDLQRQVMNAVVTISHNYQGGATDFPRRF